jgi:hypothetical protein
MTSMNQPSVVILTIDHAYVPGPKELFLWRNKEDMLAPQNNPLM